MQDDKIVAPFTVHEAMNLNAYQAAGNGRRFVCPNSGDGNHGELFGSTGTMIATTGGWICPWCDHRQEWAHGYMADPQNLDTLRF